MIFSITIFPLTLIALGIGIALLIWSRRNQGAGTMIAATFAYIIAIFAILILICSGYHVLRAKLLSAAIMPNIPPNSAVTTHHPANQPGHPMPTQPNVQPPKDDNSCPCVMPGQALPKQNDSRSQSKGDGQNACPCMRPQMI